MANHNQDMSPLFRLPTELRLEIYSYVMVPEDQVWHLPVLSYHLVQSTGVFQPMPLDRQHHLLQQQAFFKERHLSLLFSCRQIYSEASLLLFNVNTFVFDSPRLFRFLCALSTKQRDAITSLEMDFVLARDNQILLGPIMCNSDRFIHALQTMAGLKKLVLTLDYVSWRNREEIRVKLIDDVDIAAYKLKEWVRRGKGEAFVCDVRGRGLLESWKGNNVRGG